MSIVFGFMLKHEATSFSSFSLAQLCRNKKKLEETIEAKAKQQQQQQIFAIQWEIVSVNPVKKFSTSKRHVHNTKLRKGYFPFLCLIYRGSVFEKISRVIFRRGKRSSENYV